MQEISTLSADSQIQQFELMLTNIRDPQVRREVREKYNAVRQAQKSELEIKERSAEEQRRLGWAQTIEETRADLEEIGKEISRISDSKEVSRYERNPLVTAWRAKLLTLPVELRELEEKRLDILLSSRKQDLDHRKNLGAIGEAGELKFGQTTFPIFKEPPKSGPMINPIPPPSRSGIPGI
jgi:seryl-tRNA synthetase